MPVRLGAVSYLNTRPLVYGLDAQPDRFELRFDVPSRCADLLHAGAVDLGLIPSIEYVGHDYLIVPGVSIASDGPVASVAVYTRTPVADIRSIALDLSSRTSIALLRVLCAHLFGIQPRLIGMEPDLDRMLAEADAALVIGDNALFLDEAALGLTKIDLGEAWVSMTGLPFVYAFWAGRPGSIDHAGVVALQEARARGLAVTDTIGQQAFPDHPAKAVRAARYLRENVKFGLRDAEINGLRRFYELAAGAGVIAKVDEPRFF